MRRALLLIVIVAAAASCKSREPAPAPAPAPAPGAAASATTTTTTKATAAFVDVTVVPMDADHELAHQTVLVDGATIVAVGPAATTAVPTSATKIDGKGKWLIPGLIDMHVHYNDERYGTLFVANGVTTVRNMWGNDEVLGWRAKARANDASYFGPTIYTAGAIVDGDPPRWPGSHVVHNAAEAEAEVAAEAKAGYDFIKVYDGLPLAAYDALATAAKRAGIRFAGHAPKAVSLAHAFEAGQASIEHLTGYLAAAQDGKATPTPGVPRDLDPKLIAHLDTAKLPELAKQTAGANVANVPTLIVLSRFGALDHPDALRARAENKYVPPPLVASWDPQQDFRTKRMTAADFDAMRTGNQFRAKIVKALVDANAPVLVGTDTPNPFVVPGFSIHEELGLLVAAGLTPYQALRGATAGAADWLGDKAAGRIATGARADLVLLDADPLQDITATTKRAGTMVRGTWLTTQQLQSKLDALVASYAGAGDRFANAPALQVPAGEVLLRASYKTTFAGAVVGEERLAIVRAADGSRIIVAQAASDPPAPKLASVRVELDRAGTLHAFTLDEDGKRATATHAVAGKLHIEANGTTKDAAEADTILLDSNFVATMIPFAERAKPGAKTRVVGKSLSAGTGELSAVAYTFDRTAKGTSIPFTATGPFGDSPGTYEVDDKGFPTKISLKAGPGELVVTRQ